MNEHEARIALEKLAADGHVEEEYDDQTKSLKYGLTDGGKEHIEDRLRENDDMALFLFQIMWNDEVNDEPWADTPTKKLVRIACELRDNSGINILRVLKRNQDQYEGGPQIDEDTPEEILEEFDPDNSSNSGGNDE